MTAFINVLIVAVLGLIALFRLTEAYIRGVFLLHCRLTGDQFFAIGLTFVVLICIHVGAQ